MESIEQDQFAKKFHDDPKHLLNDSIDGLIQTSGGHFKRLDCFDKAIRVLVRSDYESAVKNANKVALISGGGSGHEPAHVGFIGRGMLTAVSCGDIFASPTVDSVLETIKTVTGPAGCLMIIKNYTGDRLNFGLAAEQARSVFGLNVKAVYVSDDTALPESHHPRGIAGTVFIHRFAGKMAEEGKSLEEIWSATTKYERGIISIGSSLSTCNLPGQKRNTRLDGNVYELGLGIHGEPGTKQLKCEQASMILFRMITILMDGAQKRGINLQTSKFSLLVNNLGSVTVMEMAFLSGKAVEYLGKAGVNVSHVQSGVLMGSLDMNGFSLSLAAYPENEENPLLGDVGAPAWVQLNEVSRKEDYLIQVKFPEEQQYEGEKLSEKMKAAITATMKHVISLKDQLNKWDQVSGDSDCGTTFKQGAEQILKEIDTYPSDPAQLCIAITKSIKHSMGGSSGVLLSIFFFAASAQIQKHNEGNLLVAAFTAGVEAVMKYGGAIVGSCTMVDALYPAMKNGDNLKTKAEFAMKGAESTVKMSKATHGRSQYLTGTDLQGTPDPGAMVIAEILKVLSENL